MFERPRPCMLSKNPEADKICLRVEMILSISLLSLEANLVSRATQLSYLLFIKAFQLSMLDFPESKKCLLFHIDSIFLFLLSSFLVETYSIITTAQNLQICRQLHHLSIHCRFALHQTLPIRLFMLRLFQHFPSPFTGFKNTIST